MVGVRAGTVAVATGALLVLASLAFAGSPQGSSERMKAPWEGQPTKFLDPIRAMTSDPARGLRLGTHLDLALSREGELFVADPDHHRLLRYNPQTRVLEPFPVRFDRSRPFYPTGIAVDAGGRIIVADQDGHVLLVFDRMGQLLRALGENGGRLERPLDLAIDAAGSVYVLDGVRREVQVWAPDGRLERSLTLPTEAAKPPARGATALAVGLDGTVYVTVPDAGGVIGLLPNGRVIPFEKPEDREWHAPEGIAVDETGRVYVADYHHYAIAEYTREGRFLQEHLLAKERLKQPARMAVSQQALYVVNEGQGEILQFAMRAATTGLEHAILGEEFLALREYSQAVAELSQALRLGYATAETHYLLGLAYGALDQLQEAIQQLRAAATKAPTFVEAFVQLGHSLARVGDVAAAVTQYRQALTLNPQHVAARLGLGDVSLAVNDVEGAKEQFEEVLRRLPGDVTAHVGLGRVYLAQRDYGRAERAFQEALKAEPHNREGGFFLGLTYLQSGRYPEAIPLLEQSARRGPFFVEAFYHLGRSYAGMGDKAKAAQSFKRALELQPKHAGALQGLRELP